MAYQFSSYLVKGKPSLAKILKPYPAACDVPIFYLWREIYHQWPNAKFILTIRDSNDWYDSVMGSIIHILNGTYLSIKPGDEFIFNLCREVLLNHFLKNTLHDRDTAQRIFENHNFEIENTIPKKQLLVMEIEEGWTPICDFLGLSLPVYEFPNLNSRAYLYKKYPDVFRSDKSRDLK